MENRIFNCGKCQSIIRLVPGQHVGECFSCNTRYYSQQGLPPAVVLKSELSQEQAKDLVVQGFKHQEVASDFRTNAKFAGANCYYVPIFEMRIVQVGWKTQAFASEAVFSYSSSGQLTVANDLKDLDIGTIDISLVEQALLKATYVPYNPLEMRKAGVVLPFTELKLLQESDAVMNPDIVEKFYRLIYLPVWQVSYQYNGILLKNYVSAIDGQIISLKVFKEHKKQILYSLLGLMSIAVVMGRGIIEGPFFAIVSFAIATPLIIMLVPYFWEMYAFRELARIQGDMIEKQPFGFEEHSFIETFKTFFKNILGKGEKRNN